MGYVKMLFLQLSFVCLSFAELGINDEFELDNMICSCREKTPVEKGNGASSQNPYSKPLDCNDIKNMGQTVSGQYDIYPSITGESGDALRVWCDMETDGGGWTVLQRRQDGSVNFNLEWDDYKNGFGYIGGEFWLGNENIHVITNQKDYELQVEIEEYNNKVCHVHNYDHFRLTDDANKYTLYTGTYTGNDDVCANPLGMESGQIRDDQITASSQHSSASNHAIKARLNLLSGTWYAGTHNNAQWVQVKFDVPTLVTGVVIQGRYNHASWVKEYKVQYYNDGETWKYVMDGTQENEMVFTGNTDQHTPVTSYFARPVRATYIKIRPTAWQSYVTMRFELLGCEGDFLAYQKDQAFSTKDDDNDSEADNCAATRGAWWYGACVNSGLNGPYLMGAGTTNRGIIWEDFDGKVYSIRRTEIKTRPVNQDCNDCD